MHISVMTWSNLTAKIYYTSDSKKMPLISYLLASFSASEYLLHQWSPWSFPSPSITCNCLPQQMASLQLNIKRQEAVFIWNNKQWLISWLVKVTSQLVFMNICPTRMMQHLHTGVLFNMSDILKKLKQVKNFMSTAEWSHLHRSSTWQHQPTCWSDMQ